LAYCPGCGTESEFVSCTVCWEDVCQSCMATCERCGSISCDDHIEVCAACNQATCRLCGENCSTCGAFHCDTDLLYCDDCDEYHCHAHTYSCGYCEATRCEEHIAGCTECGTLACTHHRGICTTCDDTVCDQHFETCHVCRYADERPRGFCQAHTNYCSVGGEVLCSDHRVPTTLGEGRVCAEHREACSTCKVPYSHNALTDGQCSACSSLGEVDQEHVPHPIVNEFRSVKAGANNAYLVVLGKKLLGRNQLVVYDLQAGQESHRHSAGMLKQLFGGYE